MSNKHSAQVDRAPHEWEWLVFKFTNLMNAPSMVWCIAIAIATLGIFWHWNAQVASASSCAVSYKESQQTVKWQGTGLSGEDLKRKVQANLDFSDADKPKLVACVSEVFGSKVASEVSGASVGAMTFALSTSGMGWRLLRYIGLAVVVLSLFIIVSISQDEDGKVAKPSMKKIISYKWDALVIWSSIGFIFWGSFGAAFVWLAVWGTALMWVKSDKTFIQNTLGKWKEWVSGIACALAIWVFLGDYIVEYANFAQSVRHIVEVLLMGSSGRILSYSAGLYVDFILVFAVGVCGLAAWVLGSLGIQSVFDELEKLMVPKTLQGKKSWQDQMLSVLEPSEVDVAKSLLERAQLEEAIAEDKKGAGSSKGPVGKGESESAENGAAVRRL